MTVCQDPWRTDLSNLEAEIKPISELEKERVGKYLVPSDHAPRGTKVHIVSGVYWGDESPGGTASIELGVHCGRDVHDAGHGFRNYAFTLTPIPPTGRTICEACAEAERFRLQKLAGLD